MINFDSSNWDSIRETIKEIEQRAMMIMCRTTEDELMILDSPDSHTLITEVFQKNGWILKNVYHIKDFTIEEMYERA